MTNSDLEILNYVNRLPIELVRYIKSYLPISILKKCRKIKLYELPVKFSIFKDITDHFHFKKMSNDIDHNAMIQHLKVLKIQYCQNLTFITLSLVSPLGLKTLKIVSILLHKSKLLNAQLTLIILVKKF